jgi:hypothetical protein
MDIMQQENARELPIAKEKGGIPGYAVDAACQVFAAFATKSLQNSNADHSTGHFKLVIQNTRQKSFQTDPI